MLEGKASLDHGESNKQNFDHNKPWYTTSEKFSALWDSGKVPSTCMVDHDQPGVREPGEKQSSTCCSISVDIVLSWEDQELIVDGQKLPDKHINSAQKLITSKQFNHLNGLHMTLVQDKLYSGEKPTFLQVIFIRKGH